MDALEHTYNSHTWTPCSTEDDGHSFFHAVFGVRDQDNQSYKDKDEKFRRKCWINFLTYFGTNTTCLTDLLRLRLFTNQTCDEDEYHEYVRVVSQPDYRISVEDIPFLSTVGNVRVIVFTNKHEKPTVVEPNYELLRMYPLKSKNDLKDAVIYFDGCKFLRMCPQSKILEPSTSIVANKVLDSVPPKKKYNKLSGNAGIKGSLYQINLLTIFLLNGLNKRNCWRLSTENADSGKFDDLVFELLPSESAILLQAKHRQNKFKRISYDELFTVNPDKDDFSLPRYFFSYQKIKTNFSIRNVVICTNVDLNDKETSKIVDKERLSEDHMLHYYGEGSTCYKFNKHTLPILKKAVEEFSKNARNCEDTYSDDDILDFLDHLQFICNYPSQSDLDQVIERILADMGEFCTRFESKDFSKYIIKKMIEWFEEKKGTYLTEINARALFSEIRSNKFCEKLHNCNILVKDNNPLPTPLPRILCVVSQRGYILNMIKIYVALHENETLFVNPRDDIEVQRQIVEAFEVPHYTILVACLAKAPDDVITHICDKLTGILKKFPYKKVIIISRKKDKLTERIKKANAGDYKEIYENITFNNLTEDSQERVLEKVIEFFHAKL